MIKTFTLLTYTWLLSSGAAWLAVVSRNPIHAILWLISTFLLTCGLIFHHFSLGFTASLIIIVYIGAIAILFLFIVMLIPIRDRTTIAWNVKHVLGQIGVLAVAYWGVGKALTDHFVGTVVSGSGEFWGSFSNQLGHQELQSHLPISETTGVSVDGLRLNDISIYGVQFYQEFSFTIVMVGLLLLFVLTAAIVLCRED